MKGNEADRFIERGEHLLEVNRPQDAIREFERALALRPEDAVIFCCLSRAFLSLRDYTRTIDYAKRALAADPAEEWAFRLLALGHLGKDQRKSAYRAATRAVQLGPESADCLYVLASAAFAIERFEEARLLAEMMVAQHPAHPLGHRMLGDVDAHLEDFAAASKHYEKAIELDPGDDQAMDALAAIRNRHNRFGESVSLLRGAVGVDPNPKARQSVLRDSMARFALFGEPGRRSRSVGGLLVAVFVSYVIVGLFLNRLLDDPAWFRTVFLTVFPLMLLFGIPLLRGRFFAGESEQLNRLYRNMSRQQRRRSLLTLAVIVVTAYGIATIVYFDVGDPDVFFFPLQLLLVAMWIYMLAITLRLFSLWLSDVWGRLTGRDQLRGEGRIPAAMRLLPFLTAGALALDLYYGVRFAAFLFLVGVVVSTLLYYRRFPLATSAVLVGLGAAIVIQAALTGTPQPESEIDTLGAVVAAVGAGGGLLHGLSEWHRFWQRRRIARLFDAAPPDVAESDGRFR